MEGASEPVAAQENPIIGGVVDDRRVYVVGVGDNSGAFCTGALISRRTVLTAGHCYGGITRVFFGTDLTQSPQSVSVVQEVRHPGYNDATVSHDLSIVKLGQDAPVQPVPLLRETMDNGPTFIGPDFSFVGYGNDGTNSYDVRLVAAFPIVKVGPANVGGTPGQIDSSMFYYKFPGKNTCDGDSGGPSFLTRGKVERVAGTTSFGDADCTLDGINARTDAPAIAEFIQPNIDKFEGKDPCRSDGVCSEACNVNNKLVDPDCAEDHCGADGMCVISCVNPVDPDCSPGTSCGPDGVCDPSCPGGDVDCPPAPDGGSGQGGASGQGGSGVGGSSATNGSAQGGSNPTSSGGDSGGDDSDRGPRLSRDSGCGCRVAGGDSDAEGRLFLGLVAAALLSFRAGRRR